MIFKSDAYLQRKAPIGDLQDPTEFVVPLTSDRGLCGAINSNIVRQMKEYAKGKSAAKLQIMPIGEKGSVAMARPFPGMVKTSISIMTRI